MHSQSRPQTQKAIASLPTAADEDLAVSRLTDEEEKEVFDFLSKRIERTFGMVGFIRSNGLVSPHNRGVFYACRNQEGEIIGVALIGHHILFETDSLCAIEAFARIAQNYKNAHLLLGEQEKVEAFWHYYAGGGQSPRLYCRELLLRQKWPIEVREPVPGLRLATPDDLDLIVPAHAQTVIAESGIDPLETDAEGFRHRCARRIEQGSTWVWIEDGKLIFKAEVVTDSPETVYLEGVWTNPDERGKGYGSRCMLQLGKMFLSRSDSVSLLVNDRLREAQSFYRKIGYRFLGYYDTIFLSPGSESVN